MLNPEHPVQTNEVEQRASTKSPHAPEAHEEPLSRRAFIAGAAGGSCGLVLAACGGSRHPSAAKPKPSVPPRRTRAKRRVSTTPRHLEDAIRGQVFERGSEGYAAAAPIYNERFDSVLPRAIARPLDVNDVGAAVRWAVTNGVRLVARSGGHSYAGYSTIANGVVLDLREIRSVRVDRMARTATVGPGAQIIDVYAKLAAAGATIPAGSCPSVGIGGHALGGGMGLAGRRFGLASDNLLAADLVTFDGVLHRIDADSDPDLLWGLRGGGGGNFGVVTSFTFNIHPIPKTAAWFVISYPWEVASDALAAWLDWAPRAPDALTSSYGLNAAASGASVAVLGQYFGAAGDLDSLLSPITKFNGASVSAADQDYFALQLRWAGCAERSTQGCHTAGTRPGGRLSRARFYAGSDYLDRPLDKTARSILISAIEERATKAGSGAILFDSYGGQINRLAPDASAFVHRNSLCCVQYLTYDGDDAWLQRTRASMRPYVSGYAYQNYIDPTLKAWRHAYYGSNYPRLVANQRRVDPHHFFRFPQAIGS